MQQGRGFRPEIQGLRGLAVALVVVYHLWPAVLPGGYVGVDVFFVISGYLITGLLAQMALRDGRVSLIEFYSRRVRRLLPAATLVLLVALLGTLLFISKARWEEIGNQIVASALYVENWRLAAVAVSYLEADTLPSPVQHYWSLSIEEQFYIVWPLVMIGVTWLSRRRDLPLRACLIGALSLIFAASLIASVVLTATDPAQAYFVSHTRLWELALGGLLVLTEHRFRLGVFARRFLAILGMAGILAAAVLFSATTPFPGASALLPTLATALIILAGEVEVGRFRGLDSWPLRFVGDRSYSIYLWHWPLITIFLAQGYSLTLASGFGLIAMTLVLSDLSYRYVEQRYRQARTAVWWKPLGYGTAAVLTCVVASGSLLLFLKTERIDTALIGTPSYPGPAALVSGAAVPDGVDLLPPLARLRRDVPVVYATKCHQEESSEPKRCSLGDPTGAKTIVLVGDSHAAQWVPALDKVAKNRNFKLVTFTKSACPFSRVAIMADGKPNVLCAQWQDNVLAEILKLKPYLIVTSQSNYGSVPQDQMIEGLRSLWSRLTEAGSQIVAIRNTPYMKFDPGDCLSATPTKCVTRLSDVERSNVLVLAAEGQKNVRAIDMVDTICGPQLCPAVVGNIIVWRDNHHLTATYSLALAPYLAAKAGL
ncbi:acyltransferase family protein [Mesorhizobium neociceri]|uniref:Acyltransferase n=1 Tax=Mesorhizobium neociceri TaxID=1307853 RepID=A0A838BD93_9HYPH|nr:acyltransferase family protein [Mesorhizobium neociceri]MBA1144029.1 acyltransferase [Mesorhizobium neociceri]